LRLKILKRLRAASFNSEFTGSYKKSVVKSATIIKTVTIETIGFISKVSRKQRPVDITF